jgi:hypothetical protein
MASDDDLFDWAEGRRARDEGMGLVIEHNEEFSIAFGRTIDQLPHGWIGQCEDIRKRWRGPIPAKPQAWGANWNAAKKRGLLVELQERTAMTAVKSHGRRTNLHRRV